jgi:hypothetical protein
VIIRSVNEVYVTQAGEETGKEAKRRSAVIAAVQASDEQAREAEKKAARRAAVVAAVMAARALDARRTKAAEAAQALKFVRSKAAIQAADEARRVAEFQTYLRRHDWAGVEPVAPIDLQLDDPALVEIMNSVNAAAAEFTAAAAAEAQLLEAHEGRVIQRGILRSIRDHVSQDCPGVADDSDSSSGSFPLPGDGEPEAPPPPPLADYVNTPAALASQRRYVDKQARSTAQRNYENRAAASSSSGSCGDSANSFWRQSC